MDIDFDNEQVKVAETEANANPNGSQDAPEADDFNITPIEDENNKGDTDLGQDAITLFEDDQFIFTSEGIVDKNSLTTDSNEENSGNPEPKAEDKDEKILGKFESYDELATSYKELEKKLGQNSDAVNKLRELNPVLPMLEAMLGDDTFLEMAENYFTDPEAQAKALKNQLGVDDQFVFDLNNALSDPKSEDAKVLDRLMQAKQPKQTQNKSQPSQTNPDAKKQVMEKYELSESQYEDMMARAQNHTISHDDIYFLMNRDEIIKKERQKAQQEAQKAMKEQLSNAKTLKTTRTSSSPSKSVTPEDSFMSALQQGKGLFE